jgi:hypothetical protein
VQTGDNNDNNNNDNNNNDNNNNENSADATQTGVLIPIVISSTEDGGNVVPVTTSAFISSASESVDVAITTTDDSGDVRTTSTRVPAAIVTSTNDNGDAVTTTSPIASVQVNSGGEIITSGPAPGVTSRPSSTRNGNGNNNNNDDEDNITTTDRVGSSITLSDATVGAVITTTDGRGSTYVTTITPSGGRVSQLVLKTSTLPGGDLATITSFATVGAGNAAAATASSEQATSTSRGDPSLADSMAANPPRYAPGLAALIAVAFGVVAFL